MRNKRTCLPLLGRCCAAITGLGCSVYLGDGDGIQVIERSMDGARTESPRVFQSSLNRDGTWPVSPQPRVAPTFMKVTDLAVQNDEEIIRQLMRYVFR